MRSKFENGTRDFNSFCFWRHLITLPKASGYPIFSSHLRSESPARIYRVRWMCNNNSKNVATHILKHHCVTTLRHHIKDGSCQYKHPYSCEIRCASLLYRNCVDFFTSPCGRLDQSKDHPWYRCLNLTHRRSNAPLKALVFFIYQSNNLVMCFGDVTKIPNLI